MFRSLLRSSGSVLACYRVWGIDCSSVCMGPFEGGSHYLRFLLHSFSLVQLSSVAQSGSTLCDPMDCSTPGLPVHCQLPEFTQTHVHWVSDAVQPSYPLSSPSPPAFNFSQHQGLFKWVSSLHQVQLYIHPLFFRFFLAKSLLNIEMSSQLVLISYLFRM